MKTILLLLPWLFFGAACGRKSEVPPEISAARKLAETPQQVQPSPSPKDLLTDDKLTRYIVYQREMNTVAGLVLGAAGQAFQKSGGNQKGFEKELSQDERTKKIADTEASALSKSGLTRMEAMAIAKVVSTYTPGATMGNDEMKKQAREKFTAQYGSAALAVMEKRLPELSRLQDEMLGAALGNKK